MVTTAPSSSPSKVRIKLHPGQRRTYDSQRRFVAMLAGTQGGKTSFVPIWLHREIDRCGEGDYLVGTANYDLFKLKLLPEMLAYYERRLNVGRFWAQERVIELADGLVPGRFMAQRATDPMWARIILRSADAPAGWESGTVKAACIDEAAHPDVKRIVWEATQRRLSLHQGRCLFTTTLYDWNWFKVEVYDRWKAGDKDYDVIQFDSVENPSFPMEEYDRARRTLPRWKFNLFYRGQYERPAGMIYDAFDEATALVDPIGLPPQWPRYVGHDFGPIHTAALWYAQDPTTAYLYLYRAYLSQEKTTARQHVEKWQQLSQGERIVKRVGGAVGAADEGWRDAFRQAGWPISEPVVKDVEVGIDRVYAWHKTGRLFVFRCLDDYVSEKLSYSRELDDNYNPTEKIKDKSRYHLMDAERYILSDFNTEAVKQGQSLVGSSSYVKPVRRYVGNR